VLSLPGRKLGQKSVALDDPLPPRAVCPCSPSEFRGL